VVAGLEKVSAFQRRLRFARRHGLKDRMSNTKARTVEVTLEGHDHDLLRVLAAKLELDTATAAAAILRAGIQALENEEHVIWPLYFEQAGVVTLNHELERQQARAKLLAVCN
jgi:hypothetical protein